MTEDTNELLWQQDDVAPSYPGDFAYDELGWDDALGETLGDDERLRGGPFSGSKIDGINVRRPTPRCPPTCGEPDGE